MVYLLPITDGRAGERQITFSGGAKKKEKKRKKRQTTPTIIHAM